MIDSTQRKRSAHERQWETVTSGEWASGARWAEDAPRENLDAESISLIHSGACGAFVHGLEDEFMGKWPLLVPKSFTYIWLIIHYYLLDSEIITQIMLNAMPRFKRKMKDDCFL